jgi:capsular polysaccharide transport system ATP-binding protein
MISLTNVTKTYRTRLGTRRVLDNVSFSIERGQSIGIVGRNGAGKSTLMRLIGGVEYPTSGTIRRDMTVSWPLGMSGGFQSSLTGADNARFIARIYGAPVQELVDFVEDFAELGPYMRLPVKLYSSGMGARLAFGISLAIHFDCYLIDETIAVGDARFKERCEQALLERRNRSALVMVSHEVSLLRTYCNSGAVLFDGKLTSYDDVDEAAGVYGTLMQLNS